MTYILNYNFQYVNGFSPEISGLYLVIAPLVMTITAVISGKLSDKRNPQMITIIGMVFVTLSIFMMALIDKNTSISYIVASMLVYGWLWDICLSKYKGYYEFTFNEIQ